MSSERLLGASFRGVPFFVPERTLSGGRRGATHEFPQRDLPDADDMGRKARTFRVEAQVLGGVAGGYDSYMDARDALLRALEVPGAGVYVDSWQGRWSVVARTYECKESHAEGGLARFTITFEEEGEERFPSVAIDSRAGVEASSAALTDAAKVSFTDNFDLSGTPQFVRADAQMVLDKLSWALADQVAGLSDAAAAPGETVPGIADSLDKFSRGNSALVSDGTAADIAQTVVGLFGDLSTSVAGAQNTRRLFAALNGFGGDLTAVPLTTPTRIKQSGNRSAVLNLVSDVALAAESRSLTRMSFDSADAAARMRTDYLARLDGARTAAGRGAADGGGFRDAVFSALGGLRGSVIKDMAARTVNLPRLRRIETAGPVPAVVLAHRLYGDGRRGDDILNRNPQFNHGGKIPGFMGVSVLDG